MAWWISIGTKKVAKPALLRRQLKHRSSATYLEVVYLPWYNLVLQPLHGRNSFLIDVTISSPAWFFKIQVRRLREFLVRRNVTDLSNCTEKSDLVELILERFGGESHRQTILERENRTQDLLVSEKLTPSNSRLIQIYLQLERLRFDITRWLIWIW